MNRYVGKVTLELCANGNNIKEARKHMVEVLEHVAEKNQGKTNITDFYVDGMERIFGIKKLT